MTGGQMSLFAGPRPLLRPYQQRGVAEILACLQRGVPGTLYSLPTGGGKTVVFSSVIETVAAAWWEVWVLVHRRELLEQASAALDALGVPHGTIAPDRPLTADAVQVASIDTVLARLDTLGARLARVNLALIDEAHHVSAAKWRRVLDAMKHALRLGVTATPWRYDGSSLGDVFAEAIRGPSIRTLIADGHLAPPKVFAPPVELDLSGVKRRGGDWIAGQLAREVDTAAITAAALASYARHCPGAATIAFCTTVDHAAHVAEAFSGAGWAAASIDGSMKVAERDRALRALAAGRLHVLTSCEIVSEGTDIPRVEAALLLRPTESTGLYLQQVGRCLRLSPGKAFATILDLVGNVARHGMPDEDRPWSLSGGTRGLERAVTATRRCRTCHHVCAAGPERCPHCGRVFPMRRISAGASETALATLPGVAGIPAERIRTMPLSAALEIARTESELRLVAAIRGYKPGWIAHVLAERAGEFPRRRRFG